MKALRSIIGYAIAGLLVMSIWSEFAGSYGILGGYLAAIIIIGPMWFMNHFLGLIPQDDDSAWVDMALGIAVAGTMRDTFMKGGSAFVDALPTLGLVALGAIIAGITAGIIEKNMEKET
ncbi:Lin0368 family putative glycerol transporter subunit [Caldibacillus debilis]|jgi:hypothetical protein|uniref:Lin0368 family putative glycerol transporter subunit n=1 Tax=Caldibacillus debilis TaxID=301148 RepID=UPI003A4E5971